jgi:hypothetical protein
MELDTVTLVILVSLAMVAAFAGTALLEHPLESWFVSCAIVPFYLVLVMPRLSSDDGEPVSLLIAVFVGAALSAWAGSFGLWLGHTFLRWRRHSPKRPTHRRGP